MNPMENCKQYLTGCNSQLCPLDNSPGERIWYPDEDICTARAIVKPVWVKTQRKIARRAEDRETFYTIRSLCQVQRVTGKVKGMSPDGRHVSHAC